MHCGSPSKLVSLPSLDNEASFIAFLSCSFSRFIVDLFYIVFLRNPYIRSVAQRVGDVMPLVAGFESRLLWSCKEDWEVIKTKLRGESRDLLERRNYA